MKYTIAMTGHRPKDLGGYKIPNPTYDFVRQQIREQFEKIKPTKIISGMAQGVDQWAAEIAIELEIPFIAAIPFRGQEFAWPLKEADHYRFLLTKAEKVEVVCSGTFAGWKMQKRNEWMVDNCDEVLAVWNGEKYNGTYNCIQYTLSKEKPITYIRVPKNYRPPKYSSGCKDCTK